MLNRLQAILVLLLLILTVSFIGCGSNSQEPVTAADFYKGNTINMIISSTPGGLNDRVGRVLASYLERDTGANVVVTNLGGAGGLDGMNSLYRSKPDGLTLGIASSGRLGPNEIMDDPAAAYEIDKFSYIMAIGHRLSYLMVAPDGPYQSVAELKAGENLLFGGSSPSGIVSLGGMTICEMLDLDCRVVTGINGESDRALAVKRGEIAGYAMTLDAARTSIEAGLVKPLLVLAAKRDNEMPEIPAITELGNMTEGEIELSELWETALAASNVLTAPPGIPENRLTFLRDLANEWVQDYEFREEINRVSGQDVERYASGATVTETMLNLIESLDEYRAIFAELIEKYKA